MESLASALSVSLGEIVPRTAPWGAGGAVHGAFIHISPDTLDFSINSTTQPLFQKDENRDQEQGSEVVQTFKMLNVWNMFGKSSWKWTMFSMTTLELLQNCPLLPLDP